MHVEVRANYRFGREKGDSHHFPKKRQGAWNPYLIPNYGTYRSLRTHQSPLGLALKV